MNTDSQNNSDAPLVDAIEGIFAAACEPVAPGLAAIVVKDGKVVFRKGYGMAHLEFGVPIAPEMVFRLGSITKQFTGVAILMLAEQGKLTLEDDITRFLPDYPTHGHTITVEHLLTHTSGIKSYTGMPEWLPLRRNDMSVEELIALFKDQPMEYAPGERWNYNNSGYILLGAIVEKVSGKTYERFLDEQLFKPLGMAHTCYDHPERIVPGRVAGYEAGPDGVQNAAYLSMTQPYAAGSLMSSIDDLARWAEAIATNELITKESLRRAITPYTLTDGQSAGYGYGWMIGSIEGHPTFEHGGGINGFRTYAIHLPDDRVYVAALANTTSGEPTPSRLAIKVAAEAIGCPYREPETVAVANEALERMVGVYEVRSGEDLYVTREGSRLFIQRSSGSRDEVFALSSSEFFAKDSTFRFTFRTGESGEVTRLEGRDRVGPGVRAKKTDRPLPAPRQRIELDPAVYEEYVGKYDVGAGRLIVVSREHDRLLVEGFGPSKLAALPETPTVFFFEDLDMRVEFTRDAAEYVTELIVHRGKAPLTAKRTG